MTLDKNPGYATLGGVAGKFLGITFDALRRLRRGALLECGGLTPLLKGSKKNHTKCAPASLGESEVSVEPKSRGKPGMSGSTGLWPVYEWRLARVRSCTERSEASFPAASVVSKKASLAPLGCGTSFGRDALACRPEARAPRTQAARLRFAPLAAASGNFVPTAKAVHTSCDSYLPPHSIRAVRDFPAFTRAERGPICVHLCPSVVPFFSWFSWFSWFVSLSDAAAGRRLASFFLPLHLRAFVSSCEIF